MDLVAKLQAMQQLTILVTFFSNQKIIASHSSIGVELV